MAPQLRSQTKKRQRESSEEEEEEEEDDYNDDDYDSDDLKYGETFYQKMGKFRRWFRNRKPPTPPLLPYCTQVCILGLTNNSPFDKNCPNTSLHKRGSADCGKHLITKEDLCSLTREQIARNPSAGCECLDYKGLYGKIGALFKITLTKYGYTVVAKGVQRGHERNLAREVSVYEQHLSDLQGEIVPVCLGTITLQRPYPTGSMVEVTQMMLMSWAGVILDRNTWPEDVDIEEEKEKTIQILERSGVIPDYKAVWNPERQQVMAIDFDRANITSKPRKKKTETKNKTKTKTKAKAKTEMTPSQSMKKTTARSSQKKKRR